MEISVSWKKIITKIKIHLKHRNIGEITQYIYFVNVESTNFLEKQDLEIKSKCKN